MSRPVAGNGKTRVMIGTVEVAGFTLSLASSLSAVGIEADVLELAGNPFGYTGQTLPWFSARAARWMRERRVRRASRLLRLLLMAAEVPFRLWCLGRALARYDAFVWVTGRSLLPACIDMPLIRWCGRRQLSIFLGSDSRPPYLSGISAGNEPTARRLVEVEQASRRISLHVAWCERWCDFIVNHPPAAQYHHRPYLDFATVGFPPPPAQREPPPGPPRVPGPLKIVHAPTRPAQKGSPLIRQAIASLQAAGIAIDFLELSNVSNQRLLEEVASSDLVIDQLYSDSPIGGLGREAALLGVPCLVCGYAGEALACSPALRELAAVALPDPADFGNALRELATDPAARATLAALQHGFVVAGWSAQAVGARYGRVLAGEPDPSWFVEPGRCQYFLGWGVERELLREFLAAYLRERGVDALHLGHDPGLRDRILGFCRG